MATCYQPDPLNWANYGGALDLKASQRVEEEEEEGSSHTRTDRTDQAAPGHRVYYETLWDQSYLMPNPYMQQEPPVADESSARPPPTHQSAGPSWSAGHCGKRSPGPPSTGVPRPGLTSTSEMHSKTLAASGPSPGPHVPPEAASGLAARLGGVIARLEHAGRSEAAIDDLREIEACYNAALHSGVR